MQRVREFIQLRIRVTGDSSRAAGILRDDERVADVERPGSGPAWSSCEPVCRTTVASRNCSSVEQLPLLLFREDELEPGSRVYGPYQGHWGVRSAPGAIASETAFKRNGP